MKLLFDQNLSYKLCAALADLFAGSNQARQLGLDQADDRVIWQHAKAGDYTIVSHDADFADLAAVFGAPPKVIWLRCGNQPTDVIENLIRRSAAEIAAFGHDAGANCLEVY